MLLVLMVMCLPAWVVYGKTLSIDSEGVIVLYAFWFMCVLTLFGVLWWSRLCSCLLFCVIKFNGTCLWCFIWFF
jgi:hypothetical protein